MPVLLPGGVTFDQKTETVAKDDPTVNAAIQAEQAAGWTVQSVTLDGSDVIILFSQTVYPGLT